MQSSDIWLGKKMTFMKFTSRPIIFSREVETRKLLLNQPSTESPLLMKQRLKSDTTSSHPNVSRGYQYSPQRFDKLIVAPPLAMHLNFKSHFTPLPSTLPLSGVKPWMTQLPGIISLPSEPWNSKQPQACFFWNCDFSLIGVEWFYTKTNTHQLRHHT